MGRGSTARTALMSTALPRRRRRRRSRLPWQMVLATNGNRMDDGTEGHLYDNGISGRVGRMGRWGKVAAVLRQGRYQLATRRFYPIPEGLPGPRSKS